MKKFHVRKVVLGVKMESYKGVVVRIWTYRVETWGMMMVQSHELDVIGKKCLRSLCKVTRKCSRGNEGARFRVGVGGKMSDREHRKVSMWFGQSEI